MDFEKNARRDAAAVAIEAQCGGVGFDAGQRNTAVVVPVYRHVPWNVRQRIWGLRVSGLRV